MTRILLADCETTGLHEDCEICELAFVEVDADLNEVLRFSSLVNPKGLIQPDAAGASGITNRMIEDAPTIEQVLESVRAECGQDYFSDVTLVCHNLKFDRRLLAPHWNVTGELCTLRAAQRWYPDAPNHKLQTLRHYLDIEIDASAHRALADVLVMKELLYELIEASGLGSLQALAIESAKPREITHMMFGKHRGTPLADLPGGYVGWLLGLPDLDEDLRVSLRRCRS